MKRGTQLYRLIFLFIPAMAAMPAQKRAFDAMEGDPLQRHHGNHHEPPEDGDGYESDRSPSWSNGEKDEYVVSAFFSFYFPFRFAYYCLIFCESHIIRREYFFLVCDGGCDLRSACWVWWGVFQLRDLLLWYPFGLLEQQCCILVFGADPFHGVLFSFVKSVWSVVEMVLPIFLKPRIFYYMHLAQVHEIELHVRFVIVKLAEIRKEVQCPICLGHLQETARCMIAHHLKEFVEAYDIACMVFDGDLQRHCFSLILPSDN
ncbi:hypothetical protein CK203_025778 [Vitis vinifera]|uniref:Uncharacterized protein n=1 Tax=Vitis vinifera TaxID=29760 RepID=A0A438IGA9_VITVI|nr:hypothetical protein CK203_025778 [Vitis vinifera]